MVVDSTVDPQRCLPRTCVQKEILHVMKLESRDEKSAHFMVLYAKTSDGKEEKDRPHQRPCEDRQSGTG